MTDQSTGRPRPAGWKKDPSGRHYGRWWDGSQWTENVISAEKVQSLDPLPPRPEPSIFDDAAPPPAPPRPSAPPGPRTVTMPTQPGWPEPVLKPTQVIAPTTAMRATESPTAVIRSPGGVLIARRPTARRAGAMASVRSWPPWAKVTVGIVVGLLIIAVATGGEDDASKPVSVVGQVSTTLTLPPASTTAPAPMTVPPVTQAPPTAPATTQAPATTAATAPATTAATAPATTAATAPAVTSAPSVFYANCAAVRAAGKAPIYRGQPGYSSSLDRDGDGIACET